MYKYLIVACLIVVVYYCFIHQKDVEGMASIKRRKKPFRKALTKRVKKSSSKSKKSSSKAKKVVVAKPQVKPFSEQEVRTEAKVGVMAEGEDSVVAEGDNVIVEGEGSEYIDKILSTEIAEITNMKTDITKSISVADINSITSKSGLDANAFNFKTMTDLDTAKFSAGKLLDLLSLFKNLGIDDKTANQTIKDLLGLSMTDETFKDVLVRSNIPAIYHSRFLVKFTEILKPIKLLTFTKEPALDDIPNKVMLNVSQVFPRGNSMIYVLLLQNYWEI